MKTTFELIEKAQKRQDEEKESFFIAIICFLSDQGKDKRFIYKKVNDLRQLNINEVKNYWNDCLKGSWEAKETL